MGDRRDGPVTPEGRTELAAVVMERAVAAGMGDRVRADAPIGRESWYRAGGDATLCLDAVYLRDLTAIAGLVDGTGLPVALIGAGSNLLVADAGFDGLAVRLSKEGASEFVGLDVIGPADRSADSPIQLHVGAAWFLPDLARRCAELELAGLEWTAGIPGTVGGAIRMNAGVEKDTTEVRHSLLSATVTDLRTGVVARRSAEEFGFAYRHSEVAAYQAVTSAVFAVRPGERSQIEAENQRRLRHRREAQETVRTAGSVWRNPEGDSAYRVILDSGCAGLRIGSAQISPKHANFIVVDKGGRADDVYRLMVETRRRVFVERGVQLHAETVLLGYSPLDLVG